MTLAFSARRSADTFDALVSGDSEALTEKDAREFAALLQVVQDLRALPEVTAREAFIGDLRERLMLAADTDLVASAAPTRLHTPVRTRPQQRRLAALIGSAAFVGATATVAVAAQSALPGEALYPIKRGIEATQLQLESGTDRGHRQLALAEERLSEVEALVLDPDASSASFLPSTLDSFTEHATDGVELLLEGYESTGDKALVERAHEFNSTSMGRLDELEDDVPADALDALVRAGRTLADLDASASTTCASCSGGISTVPDFLLVSQRPELKDLLGVDRALLPPAPSQPSGQDVDGIVVPDGLLTPPPREEPTLTPGETTTTDKVKESVKDTAEGTKDSIKETLDDTVEETVEGGTDLVEGATEDVIDPVDEVVGGTLGEVSGDTGEVGNHLDVIEDLLP